MNRDVFKGKWLQLKGEVRTQWGKLTADEQCDRIQGNSEKLVGKLQEHYGYAEEQAQETKIRSLRPALLRRRGHAVDQGWVLGGKTPPGTQHHLISLARGPAPRGAWSWLRSLPRGVPVGLRPLFVPWPPALLRRAPALSVSSSSLRALLFHNRRQTSFRTHTLL